MLLDTHAFLWFVYDDVRLPDVAAERIEAGTPVLSTASIWEIAIKEHIGRLGLGMPFERFLSEHVMGHELDVLEVDPAHVVAYHRLPLHHRDPFDRMLVAQAQVLGVPIISRDERLAAYDVEVVWS